MRVGLVGTGAMGRPLVDRILAAGFDLAVFVRRGEVWSDLEEAGAQCVDTLDALPSGRDVIIVYVYSDGQIREVVQGGLGGAMEAGSLLVVHTTGNPRTMEMLQAQLEGRGVGVVDAPGSGGPSQVAAGSLTLFVGGQPHHVDRCRPLFEAYATQSVYFGPLGSGQKAKLLNNLLFGAHVELAVQVSQLSADFGIDPLLLASTLRSCSGASYALDLLVQMGSAQSLLENAGPFVHKDVLVAGQIADDIGASLGSIAPAARAMVDRTRDG